MTKQIENLALKLRAAQICVSVSYVALIGVLSVWALAHEHGFSIVLWLIACVPLLILAPAMWRKHHRAYSWLCFVILLYFVKAVEGSLSSVATWIDFSMLVLSVVIFVSAMLTSRWLQYARVQLSSVESEATPKEKELP